MLCKEITKVIEAAYPREAALDFDNVGLLAGRNEKEVHRMYIALDATGDVIKRAEAAGADMLITHHPLIFSPLKSVTDTNFIGRRLVELIQSDIAYYAMHTNYDVLRMAYVAEKILGLEKTEVLDATIQMEGKEEGIGRVGELPYKMSLKECCGYVKHKLKLESLKIFGDMHREVKRLAVSPGSGHSAVKAAILKKADVLVTGDIGHHDGLDAVEQGLSVIDAGHYGTEYIFIDDMKRFLEKNFPDLEIMTAPIVHPFQVV